MTPIKRNGTYYAVWTCTPGACGRHEKPAQHWSSLRTGDKREAQGLCSALEEKLDNERRHVALGLPIPRQASDMTLKAFRAAYLESTQHDKSEATYKTEASHLQVLIGRLGGDFKLSGLNQEVLEGYKKYKLTKCAPRSWNSCLATLKSIFAWGLRRDPPLYTANPFGSITRVDKGTPTREKFIEPEDLEKVVVGCTDPYWVTVMQFLYLTGCRGGELRNLKWADIKDGELEFRRPKERKVKKLLVTDAIVNILNRAKQYAPTESEYVFPGRNGGMLTGQVLHANIQAIGRKVGVVLGPHRFRHTRAKTALKQGAPSISVQAMLGHASIRTTEEYIHVRIEDSKEALETGGILGT